MSIPARNANISAQRRFSLDVAHLLETPLKAMQPCLAYRIDDWQYVQKLADRLRCSLTALPIDALEQASVMETCMAGTPTLRMTIS